MRRVLAIAGLAGMVAFTAAPLVLAQPHGVAPTTRPGPQHSLPVHGANPHGAHGAAEPTDAVEHEEHDGPPGPINWASGLLGEKEGLTEPNLLWRPKGMPVPFLASLVNFAVLLGLGVKFGAKPLSDGLKKRKEDLMRDIDDAAKVKAEAQARYDEYKAKLDAIEGDVSRIKQESSEAGVREQERLTKEAADKRARLKRDAEFLLEQERKLARQQLVAETVTRASAAARQLLQTKLAQSDQDRLADEYLKGLGSSLKASTGGAA